jgi:anti-sigma regulatory factor (Ser/Thr protein kinase)
MGPVVEVTLPAAPEAPSRARQSLRELHSVLDPRVFADLRLLVSELVTNSLRHAGLSPEDVIRLRVDLTDGTIRAEVYDEGPGFSLREDMPSLYQQNGWGLFLVREIADRWGVELSRQTCVWFELSRAG